MRTTFITSGPRYDLLPDLGLPEVAFVGRSNVGKSSLLNALVDARIARTSSTPGRTQHINLFQVHARFGDFALADLPGYGFAKAPKNVRTQWGPMVEGYLGNRTALCAVLFLIDARRGIQADDQELFNDVYPTLRERRVMSPVLVTKIDKLPKAQRKPALHTVAKALQLPREMVLATSASERIGLDVLKQRLSAWVTGASIQADEDSRNRSN